MDLYFPSTSEAGHFMSALKKHDWAWRMRRVQFEYPTAFSRVFLACAKMEKLYRTHYNTRDNLDSPEYPLPPDCLERVVLDDEDKLQMFEENTYMREVHAYMCNMSRTQGDTRVNNTLNMSWLCYLYFKGAEGVIPCMLVSPTAIQARICLEKVASEAPRATRLPMPVFLLLV
jgi:hypothetical protein